MSNLYLLQNNSAGYLGNSPLFWHESNCGYTVNIDEAKRWTWKETRRQIRSTRGTHRWTAIKLSDCENAAIRVVDIQRITKRISKKGA